MSEPRNYKEAREMEAANDGIETTVRGYANLSAPSVTLLGEQATTHEALAKASRKVEEANRILTDAQSEFRAALAAHLKAITGAKVEP